MKKVAIQGVLGSYHDIAAHKYFKDETIELICCNTFEEVFAEMKQDDSVLGVVAIENTIAGSLLHNYEANTNCASATALCACPAKTGAH